MTIDKSKQTYTTGQVAQICNVAPRTVTKWFDSGKLKGYRIPGSRDRRIPTTELLRFMRFHEIPTNGLEETGITILIVDSDHQRAEVVAGTIQSDPAYSVHIASSDFEAGILTQKICPQVILVNLSSVKINADYICNSISRNSEFSETKVIAITAHSSQYSTEAIIKKGYDQCLTDVENPQSIFDAIDRVLAVAC